VEGPPILVDFGGFLVTKNYNASFQHITTNKKLYIQKVAKHKKPLKWPFFKFMVTLTKKIIIRHNSYYNVIKIIRIFLNSGLKIFTRGLFVGTFYIMLSRWVVFLLFFIFLDFLEKMVSNLHQFLRIKTQREIRGFKKISIQKNNTKMKISGRQNI